MKSIGFVVLNKDNKIEGDFSNGSEDELRRFVSIVNAAPNTFNMTSYCPLRVVEAFINDE